MCAGTGFQGHQTRGRSVLSSLFSRLTNTWKVSVCQGTPFSPSISTLSPESLSGVTSFSGTHQQLQALPHLHSSLKSVTFRDPVETREVSSITVASLLRDITSLTELKVSFTLHSMYDSGNLLRSLVQACPNLRRLDLTCEHKPSFHLASFLDL